MRGPCTLEQSVVRGVRRPSLPISELVGTYQLEPVGIRVHLGVLGNVPIRHPRSHDAERKLCLRNLDDREYVWMRNIRVPLSFTTVDLQ
jgi:hypothetical protein